MLTFQLSNLEQLRRFELDLVVRYQGGQGVLEGLDLSALAEQLSVGANGFITTQFEIETGHSVLLGCRLVMVQGTSATFLYREERGPDRSRTLDYY
jgi:hypothetical protein